jgi:hypothetical protein
MPLFRKIIGFFLYLLDRKDISNICMGNRKILNYCQTKTEHLFRQQLNLFGKTLNEIIKTYPILYNKPNLNWLNIYLILTAPHISYTISQSMILLDDDSIMCCVKSLPVNLPYIIKEIPPGRKCIQIVGSMYGKTKHGLALLDDGNIMCWGNNDFNQAPDLKIPPEGHYFIQIAAGIQYSLGLLENGTVIGWGNNKYGQAPLFKESPPNKKFIQIVAHDYNSLGLLNDGTAIGWGNNTNNAAPPIVLPPPNRYIIQIETGYNYSSGLLDDGSVMGWGGELDIKELRSPTSFRTPREYRCHMNRLTRENKLKKDYYYSFRLKYPPLNKNFIQIINAYHMYGLLNDGNIMRFNKNDYNRTGTIHIITPPIGSRFIEIAKYDSADLVVKLDNGTIMYVVNNHIHTRIFPPIPPPGRSFK